MVVVFAAFVTLRLVFIQQLGLGLAVAVLIDATIVRSVLLPATMTAARRLELVAAAFLRWLPKVTIEVEPEDAPLGHDPRAGGLAPAGVARVGSRARAPPS